MQSDKLPLYEAECISKKRRESVNRNTSTVIFVLLIFLLFTTFTFLSWYSMDLWHNRNDVKPPFNPPSRDDLAKTARYIAHYMDWCTISTISVGFGGIPFAVPISVADGPVNNSTGVPYIYIAPAAPSSKDLQKNASSSFCFSEAMSNYCSRNNYIAEDPRCARLTLSGKVVKLTADEIPFAKEALFSRNPVMKYWPASHDFYFAKLEISRVHLLDTFGPAIEIPVKDYFAAKV